MRIVGVVRTLNEDDIIEAVLRHHLAQMDAVIVLDDGSNDRTVEIVSALQQEGSSVELVQRRCVIFDEGNRNTFLYSIATSKYNADWVVFFDADEFVDMREANTSLRDYLSAIPAEYEAVSVRLVNYLDSVEDDEDDILVPRRMTWRYAVPHEVYKVFVRALSNPESITIHAGNHTAYRNGVQLDRYVADDILLAHYPRRSGWQNIYKVIIGRLKINAAGSRETSRQTGVHYVPEFDILLNNPGQIIYRDSYFKHPPNKKAMISSPIAYLGEDLRYTGKIDYKMKCLSMVLKYANELATEFGYLMDSNPDVQKRIARTLEIDFETAFDRSARAKALSDERGSVERVPAVHPHWQGYLLLSQSDLSVVHEASGNRGTYRLSGGVLTIRWDNFPQESFYDVRGNYVHETFVMDRP